MLGILGTAALSYAVYIAQGNPCAGRGVHQQLDILLCGGALFAGVSIVWRHLIGLIALPVALGLIYFMKPLEAFHSNELQQCVFRGYIRGLSDHLEAGAKVQLLGTQCAPETTDGGGYFRFMSCDRDQTQSLLKPSVQLTLNNGAHCEEYLEWPPAITKITILSIKDDICTTKAGAASTVTSDAREPDDAHLDHDGGMFTDALEQYRCHNGKYIPYTSVCDGITDCRDGEDELLCSTPRECCISTKGCPGETGTSCVDRCCCCPVGQRCCQDPSRGCCVDNSTMNPAR